MKKFGIWIATFLVLLQVGLSVFLDWFYVYNVNYTAHAIAVAGLFAVAFATAFYYGALCEWETKKKLIVSLVSTLFCPGIVVILGMYLLRDVANMSREITASIVLSVVALYALVYFILQLKEMEEDSSAKKVVACVLVAIFLLSEAVLPVGNFLQYHYKVPTITGLSTYHATKYERVENADVFVSTDGDDEMGTGTFGNPYRTIGRAKQAVKDIDKTGKSGITVAIKAGEYRVGSEVFTDEDGGTETCPVTYCAYGDGEVVLNGGITLASDSFSAVPAGEMKNRLKSSARDKVVCVDLSTYGIGKEDYGKINAIGSYNTASKYDGGYVGPIYSELFFNDTRMNLARYPDSGFLKTGKVVEMGKGLESDGSKTADPEGWAKAHNPQSDTYALSQELTDRIASWKTLDDVWMFGFWKYTWADASTLIGKFDKGNRTLTTKFVSLFGAISDAPYYFFNVFEELDAPGEWYLDRDSGVLYMYPLSEMKNATIDLSLATDPVIKATASNLRFINITVKGTRGDGVELVGDNNIVDLCTIKNVSGNALFMTGYNNRTTRNEITRTGKGGIILDGGDRETLKAGGNVADNNYVHDWSEIYQTYQPAVTLNGVGNICSHNEMCNSPHEAVTYSGNNHVIEYNDIHNVCLLSDDAGAIYSGRRWDWYGTVIRYNAVYDLGTDDHFPCGIYMDDALSGQTIYGNIMVNVPNTGIELGGGRDLIVKNNIIINTNYSPMSYDDRAREGVIVNGWFDHSSNKDADMWVNLDNSPWKTEVWQNAFPQYKRYSDDFSDTDNKDFVPNPSYSEVTGNIRINLFMRSGMIDDSVYTFSTVENNPIYSWLLASAVFTDWKNGDYTLKDNSIVYKKLPDFEQIPISQIGRY